MTIALFSLFPTWLSRCYMPPGGSQVFLKQPFALWLVFVGLLVPSIIDAGNDDI
jgi:hypothetical protein